MKIEKIIYQCDICGNELSTGVMRRFDFPCRRIIGMNTLWEKAVTKVDMCQDCFSAYFAFCDQHFATVKSNGLVLETIKKFKTEDPFTTEESEEFKNAPNT